MNKKLSVIAIAASMLFCQGATAQKTEMGVFNHVAVGVSMGVLDGVGFEVAAPVTSFLAVRAGFSYMPNINYTFNLDLTGIDNYTRYFIKDDVDIKGELDYKSWKLLVDFNPFKSGFRITAGAYLGDEVFLSAHNTEEFLKDTYKGTSGVEEGDYKYMSDMEGNVKADIRVKKLRPYLGIGFGRAVPKKRLSVNFDLGAQFWGKPELWTDVQDERYGNTVYSHIEKDHVKDKDFKDGLDILSKIIVSPVLSVRICGRIL